MEIKQSFLRSNAAKEAIGKLLRASFPADITYDIRRLHYWLEKAHRSLDNQTRDVVKKYAVLDEKGEFIAHAGPFNIKLQEGKLEEAVKEANSLLDKPYELEKCKKLHMDWIQQSKDLLLSAFELESLEPIMDGVNWEA